MRRGGLPRTLPAGEDCRGERRRRKPPVYRLASPKRVAPRRSDAPAGLRRAALAGEGGNVMSRVPHRATSSSPNDDAVIRSNLALLLRVGGYDVRERPDGAAGRQGLEDPTSRSPLLDLQKCRCATRQL